MVSASGDFESRQARIRLSGASRLTSLTIFAQTLTIGGSGACQMALTGYVDNLSTELSGASRASLSLDCQEARFLGSGASEFRLLGESEKAEIVVTSASSVRAYGFTVGQLKATASGASGIRIRVSEQIDASATGASTIRYEGDPEVRSLRSSSSGSIRKGND
jgi:hypothetical protein